jgi:CRISPR/Cas system CSM-associated protein Csm2 small subunit
VDNLVIKKSSIWIILIATLCIILTGCNEQKKYTQIPNNVKATSSDSAIVAQVENTTITASQFLSRVQNEKQAFESIKKPQSEEFYKRVTLGLMIQEILLANEAQKQGITVSREETVDVLNQQMRAIESLGENDPEKIRYLKKIKAQGLDNPSDFVKSSEVISDTQKSLVIGKLLNKSGTNITDTLLNQKNYKIYVPIDISEFQKDIDNTLGSR